MKSFLYFGFLLAVFASCEKQKTDEFPELILPSLQEQLSDTLANYDKNSEVPELYEIYYIGQKQDTVELDYNMRRFVAPPPPPPLLFPPKDDGSSNFEVLKRLYDDSISLKKKMEVWKALQKENPFDQNLSTDYKKYRTAYDVNMKDSIKIVVDTTKHLTERRHWYFHGGNERYPAYAVMLENISNQPLVVGAENFISLTKEIKNEHDEWIQVNQVAIFECGIGIRNFVLLPNQIIITSTLQFKEVEKARLRMGESISNEY